MSYLRKVTAGQPVEISAAAWNTLMDMAHEWLGEGGGRKVAGRYARSAGSTIQIKNNSPSARGRYDVLGIDSTLITPAANEAGFLQRVVFSGSTPSSTTRANGRFCVLAEPAAAGKIAKAWASGMCHAWINVTNESHGFADLSNGDATKLISAETGPCVILWK